MADWIDIRNLEVECHIGVPDEERATPQKLKVSVSMKAKGMDIAAQKDDVSLTTNYYDVAQRIKATAAARQRKLIETLAEDVANLLLKEFHLRQVEVEIHKFILPDADWVGVRISRKIKKPSKKTKLPPR